MIQQKLSIVKWQWRKKKKVKKNVRIYPIQVFDAYQRYGCSVFSISSIYSDPMVDNM